MSEEYNPLPSSLLSKLSSDDKETSDLIAFGSLQEATSATRAQADRLFLASTAPAIRKVKTIMESGSDRDALAAANLILTKSPATKESLVSGSSGLSLNPEALNVLLKGLSLFAQGFVADSRQPPIAPADYKIVEEETDE